MEFSPYVTWYEKTATERPSFDTLTDSIECDICIIGGAFTGVDALLHAAEKGQKAVLIEPGKIGYGCTGRAGGLIESGLNTTIDDLSDFYGRLSAHSFWNSTIEARDKIVENIRKYNINCDYVEGLTYISRNKLKRDGYINYVNYFSHYFDSDPIESLTHDDVQQKLKMPSAVLGMHFMKSGGFNPLSYLFGMAQAAVTQGAKIYENTSVVAIDEKEKITVQTNAGTVVCDHVIVCGNAYMGGESSPEKTQTVSMNYFQIVTKPLEQELLDLIAPQGPMVAASRGDLRSYLQITADKRIVYGGPEFSDVKNGESFAAQKLKELYFYLPDIKGHVEVDYVWSGAVGVPMNYVPIFHKVSNRHYVTHGFNGHGVAISCFAGHVIVDAILEDDGLYDIYSRIKPRPIPQWVHHTVAKVTLILYRLFARRFNT